MSQPITAARESVQRDGLVGAIGYGVVTSGTEASGATSPSGPAPGEVDGIPAPIGEPDGAQFIPTPEAGAGDPLDPASRWDGPGGYELWGEPCSPHPYLFDPSFGATNAIGRTWGTPVPLYTSITGQHAFGIGAGVKASTFEQAEIARAQEAAQRVLELTQWNQIAHELWTGARDTASGYGTNVRLASPSATVLAGGNALDVVEGIAAMEDALGHSLVGAVTLIHCPRKMIPYASHHLDISTSPGNGRIFTANDTLVIGDRGYPGTGPHGEQPLGSKFWIYGTGVLTARLGAIRFGERDPGDAVSAPTNDLVVHAERPAAIGWLCGHFAALIDLTLAPGSTAGVAGDGLSST